MNNELFSPPDELEASVRFPFAAVRRLCYGRLGLGEPEHQASAVARVYRAAAPWLAATWQFVGAALVGVGLGRAVDHWVGAKAGIGVVVGGLVGSILGGVAFIRSALKLLDSQSQSKAQSKVDLKKRGPS